ncbi:transposase [Microcoleus sp. S28C3]|uniref:transposase n=1 Tax=Microcoleus sp. S28C3 TaxID=3055414 RepID=UPI00403FAFBC
MRNGIFKRFERLIVGNNRAFTIPEEENSTPSGDLRDNSFSGIFYQLKNGCNWGDLPRDIPPYSTVFWHYQNWFEHGSLERIETQLHSPVREQVKKKRSGRL